MIVIILFILIKVQNQQDCLKIQLILYLRSKVFIGLINKN